MYSTPGDISILTLRLSDEIEQRLAALVAKTGRSKSFYARAAILKHLKELEDAYLPAERLRTEDANQAMDARGVNGKILTWTVEWDDLRGIVTSGV